MQMQSFMTVDTSSSRLGRLHARLPLRTRGLVGGGAIVVPGGQIVHALGHLVQHASFASHVLLRAAEPDVLRHELAYACMQPGWYLVSALVTFSTASR